MDSKGNQEIDVMAEEGNGGMCIEICVRPDGRITVESGPLDDEGQEATGTPVENIEEALAKAKELYAAGGRNEDAFNEGYGKPQASPMMVREAE